MFNLTPEIIDLHKSVLKLSQHQRLALSMPGVFATLGARKPLADRVPLASLISSALRARRWKLAILWIGDMYTYYEFVHIDW